MSGVDSELYQVNNEKTGRKYKIEKFNRQNQKTSKIDNPPRSADAPK